jgi:hypothetical protein
VKYRKERKMNELSIYECEDLMREIEELAAKNEGELTDEQIESLVKAQTTSIEKLGKMVNYIKYLEGFSSLCKSEKARISERQRVSDNRITSIKKYLTPYVVEKGKQTIGTTTLSIRKSTSVNVVDAFHDEKYGEWVKTFKPDKKAIKKFLVDNPEMGLLGATLEHKNNLQVK